MLLYLLLYKKIARGCDGQSLDGGDGVTTGSVWLTFHIVCVSSQIKVYVNLQLLFIPAASTFPKRTTKNVTEFTPRFPPNAMCCSRPDISSPTVMRLGNKDEC